MIKKTLSYEDLDGNEITEDFYFHLNRLELIKMDLEVEGGLEAYLKQISEANNALQAYNLFEKILLSAYGRRREDNKGFDKRDEWTNEFEQSEALGALVFELLSDPHNAAKDFVEKLLPQKLVKEAAAANAESEEKSTEKAEPTEKDIREMSHEELLEAYKAKNQSSN